MKKILTNRLFLVLLTAIIVASGTAYATIKIQATEIGYDGGTWKKSDGTDITNAKEAIDELYKSKQLVKSGDIVYKESYSNTRYDELHEIFDAGNYICTYNYAVPAYDINQQNIRDSSNRFDVTISGCDEYNELNNVSYRTTGKNNFLSSNTFVQLTGTVNFNCKLDSKKQLSAIFNGDNSDVNPTAANLFCVPITIN